MILKREHFITEPSYCYETVIILFILSVGIIISIVARLPIAITIIIAVLEVSIYIIQRFRIYRHNKKE